MNILFVTDLCPIEENEKLPLALLDFILSFKKLGHNVTLFRPNVILNVLIRGRKLLKEGIYSYKGIRCINKNYMTPFFNENDFEFLKDENFDIILSHMPSGILASNKISKRFNIPYFTSVHSSDIKVLSDFKYSFLKEDMKKAYLEAKKVLPRSFWLDDKIKSIIPNIKTSIIPSGIDSNIILDNVSKKEIKIKILSAGSLIKRKNFETLIEAVSELNLELQIIGDGKNRKNLEKLVKKRKANVIFLGKMNKSEVLDKMKEADIFILPSFNETFGLVYLEALSQGCIVVCSKNSGMAGFIEDNVNGFLAEPNVISIKNVIKRIFEAENTDNIRENALKTAREMEKIKMAENYLKNILF